MADQGLLSKRTYGESAPKIQGRRSPAAARAVRLFLLLPALGAAGAVAAANAPAADLVLRNGKIYTVDAARSWAEAIAIRGDRIVWVGPSAEAGPFVDARTKVIDLGGRFVLPGFHDRHVHPLSGGVELNQCDLNGSKSRDEVLTRVRACAARLDDQGWLQGGGWDLPLFEGGVAKASELDAIVGDRPAALYSADGHSVWVSSRTLTLAGISKTTPDPVGGRIERDGDGAPIGTLRESAAHLVDPVLPDATPAELLAGLKLGAAKAKSFGIVALTEASASPEYLAAFDALDRQGELDLRVVVSQHLGPEEGRSAIAERVRRRSEPHGPHVRATAVKLFADGVIEGGTAALLEPYVGRPGSGIPNWDREALRQAIVALDREKFQIHVHAIGDRAIRDTLDALEAARATNGVRDARPLLAHIQLFHPSDIPRFRELGAIADFQPLWAWFDPYIRDLTEPFLGPERSRWLYPIRSMAATGAVLAAGSDWSVSSMNPLEAIEVAITRCDPALPACDKPWIPEERVDLATMIAAYTIGGAYAGFEERDSGSLEAGKLADLVVLDRDLFAIPPGEISEARVLVTLFEGRPVFGSLEGLAATPPPKAGR